MSRRNGEKCQNSRQNGNRRNENKPSGTCLKVHFLHCGLYLPRCCVSLQISLSISAAKSENISSDVCAQRRFRLACAFAQSDQNLLYVHFRKQRRQSFSMRTTKSLIRLSGCVAGFECSLWHISEGVFSHVAIHLLAACVWQNISFHDCLRMKAFLVFVFVAIIAGL